MLLLNKTNCRQLRLLVQNYASLIKGINDPKIFVPLCGKSVDLLWLSNQSSVKIIGAEGVVNAIKEFETESRIKLHKIDNDYVTDNDELCILLRNFFDAKSFDQNIVNCVYDRASFVAIDPVDRTKYVETMKRVIDTNNPFNYILVVVEYDTNRVQGPPHSVTRIDIENLFGSFCAIKELSRNVVQPVDNSYIKRQFIDSNTSINEITYHLSNK